jgi:hypothetical protein
MTFAKRPKRSVTTSDAGVIHCDNEVRGKHVRSIYVSADDQFNIVSIDFTDGTALTVEIIPIARLRTELSDWTSGNMKSIKRWREIMTR